MTQDIPNEQLLNMQRVCKQFGLDIKHATRHGVMLSLVPVSLESLPGAEQLRAIADHLGGDGVRYVTLVLEEE